MIDWQQLFLFELILMRMSGFILFNPLLGRNNLPGTVKAGLIMVLSVSVFGLEPALTVEAQAQCQQRFEEIHGHGQWMKVIGKNYRE